MSRKHNDATQGKADSTLPTRQIDQAAAVDCSKAEAAKAVRTVRKGRAISMVI